MRYGRRHYRLTNGQREPVSETISYPAKGAYQMGELPNCIHGVPVHTRCKTCEDAYVRGSTPHNSTWDPSYGRFMARIEPIIPRFPDKGRVTIPHDVVFDRHGTENAMGVAVDCDGYKVGGQPVDKFVADGAPWHHSPHTQHNGPLPSHLHGFDHNADGDDPVTASLVRSFRERARVGREKYGVSIMRTDLSLLDWIRHAREEAQDFIVYLTRIEMALKEKGVSDENAKAERAQAQEQERA